MFELNLTFGSLTELSLASDVSSMQSGSSLCLRSTITFSKGCSCDAAFLSNYLVNMPASMLIVIVNSALHLPSKLEKRRQ